MTAWRRLLRRLAARQDVMLVMGGAEARPRPDARPARRWAGSDPDRNTLVAVDRAWLAIDVDGYAVPAPWGRPTNCRTPRAASVTMRWARRSPASLAWSPRRARRAWPARRRPGCGCSSCSMPRIRSPTFTAGRAAPRSPACRSIRLCCKPASRSIRRGRSSAAGSTDPVPPALRAFVLPGMRRPRGARRAPATTSAPSRSRSRVEHARMRCDGDWRQLLDETLGGPASFFLPLTQALGMAARSPEAEDEILGDVAVAGRQAGRREPPAAIRAALGRSTLRRFRHFDRQVSSEVAALRAAMFAEAGR